MFANQSEFGTAPRGLGQEPVAAPKPEVAPPAAVPAPSEPPPPTRSEASAVRLQAQGRHKPQNELSLKQKSVQNYPDSAAAGPVKKKVKIEASEIAATIVSALGLLVGVGMLVLPPAQKMAAG